MILVEAMEIKLLEKTAKNTSVDAVETSRIPLRRPPEPKVTGSTPVGDNFQEKRPNRFIALTPPHYYPPNRQGLHPELAY